MPSKTAWRPKKEQKRTKKQKQEQQKMSFSNIIVDNITM